MNTILLLALFGGVIYVLSQHAQASGTPTPATSDGASTNPPTTLPIAPSQTASPSQTSANAVAVQAPVVSTTVQPGAIAPPSTSLPTSTSSLVAEAFAPTTLVSAPAAAPPPSASTVIAPGATLDNTYVAMQQMFQYYQSLNPLMSDTQNASQWTRILAAVRLNAPIPDDATLFSLFGSSGVWTLDEYWAKVSPWLASHATISGLGGWAA